MYSFGSINSNIKEISNLEVKKTTCTIDHFGH